MAISVVGSNTYVTAATTTENLTLPTVSGGILEDDIIEVCMSSDASAGGTPGTPITTAGYTDIVKTHGDAGKPLRYVAYKRMGATPDTVVGVDSNRMPPATAERKLCTAIRVIRGVDATTAEDVAASITANGTSGMPNAASITPVTSGALVCAGGFLDDENGTDTAVPSGYSDFLEQESDSGSANSSAVVMVASILWTSGAEDPPIFTSAGGMSDGWYAATWVWRPASTAHTATATQTLPKISQAGTGAMQPSGTGAQTLPSLGQAGTGIETFTATAAQTLAAFVQAGTGLATQPTGSAAQILAAITQAGSGSHLGAPSGSAALTLTAITQAGTGVEIFTGSAALTLAALTQAGTGVMQPSGSAAQTLAALTQAGVGVYGLFTGSAAQTLAAVTQAGTGLMHPQATAAQFLAAITQAGTGVHDATGSAAQTLASLTQAGTGAVVIIGVNEYPGPQPIPAQPDITGIVRTLRGAFVALDNLLLGKTNNTGVLVLTPSAASTVVTDARMTINSVLYFDPLSVNAALELAAGTMVALKTGRRNGTFTVTHANNAQNDRAFRYEIKG
jgi:hypothetical protein